MAETETLASRDRDVGLTSRDEKFARLQDVKFDFTADLTGTGDRSVNVISET